MGVKDLIGGLASTLMLTGALGAALVLGVADRLRRAIGRPERFQRGAKLAGAGFPGERAAIAGAGGAVAGQS